MQQHDLVSLSRQVERWRRAEQVIVFANGCFDLLHRGHLHALRTAAGQGDKLIVGVNSDASVRALKGPSRPVHDQATRVRLLCDLRYVDAVIAFDGPDPGAIIEAIRPDVLVKGSDWRGKRIVGAEFAGRLHFVESIEGVSTTRIISAATACAP